MDIGGIGGGEGLQVLIAIRMSLLIPLTVALTSEDMITQSKGRITVRKAEAAHFRSFSNLPTLPFRLRPKRRWNCFLTCPSIRPLETSHHLGLIFFPTIGSKSSVRMVALSRRCTVAFSGVNGLSRQAKTCPKWRWHFQVTGWKGPSLGLRWAIQATTTEGGTTTSFGRSKRLRMGPMITSPMAITMFHGVPREIVSILLSSPNLGEA